MLRKGRRQARGDGDKVMSAPTRDGSCAWIRHHLFDAALSTGYTHQGGCADWRRAKAVATFPRPSMPFSAGPWPGLGRPRGRCRDRIGQLVWEATATSPEFPELTALSGLSTDMSLAKPWFLASGPGGPSLATSPGPKPWELRLWRDTVHLLSTPQLHSRGCWKRGFWRAGCFACRQTPALGPGPWV